MEYRKAIEMGFHVKDLVSRKRRTDMFYILGRKREEGIEKLIRGNILMRDGSM